MFPRNRKDAVSGLQAQDIAQYILSESKTRRKHQAITWIDYKKAYDIVPQSWIISCQKIYKISDEAINFIEKSMETWWMELTARGKRLAETKIQRSILQGNTLSQLLFVMAMMTLNHILGNAQTDTT